MTTASKSQKRIHELSKDFKISSQALVAILKELGFEIKSHMSVATPEMIAGLNLKLAQERQSARKEMHTKDVAAKQAQSAARIAAAAPAAGAVVKPKLPDNNGQPPVPKPAYVPPPRPASLILPSQLRAAAANRSNTPAAPGAPPATGLPPDPNAANSANRRKDKKKGGKRDRFEADQEEIARTFRATINTLDVSKVKTKVRRREDGQLELPDEDFKTLEVNEYISVAELAALMDARPVDVVGKLFAMGAMATINHRLDMDTIIMVAAEYGYEVKRKADIAEEVRQDENVAAQVERAPVVTVMGHVDHGKTSLLDYIRKTNVVSGESGAITQHIGAYEVSHNKKRIIFLDTPGHEAFTAMRARGAQLTDVVIVVVAADEGMRPQTIEAIDHARAANCPIIVAITKIDKPNAVVDNVKRQLAEVNLLPEDWGGKIITVPLSSKTGEGIDRLLDMILLQAEVMELKADPTIRGQGTIIDARLEKGRGPVVTVLIQRGICRIGDIIVAGVHSGRIRTMQDDRNHPRPIGEPSMAVQITGLSGVPQAGDSFMVAKDEEEAREITLKRDMLKREYEARRPMAPTSLDKVYSRIKEGYVKEVRLLIKGDVDGSVEVLADQLGKIQNAEVKTTIIRRGVGGVTETDVLLAAASDAIIIAFQVSIDPRARETAKREKVDVREYSIIYEAENDVRKALEGLLSPEVSESFVGLAEVREVFKVPKIGSIAGSIVKQGRINRKDQVRLQRDGKIIYTGMVASLRRFKDDAKEVKEGFECGIGIENFNDIKVGDVIEAFEMVETARVLEA